MRGWLVLAVLAVLVVGGVGATTAETTPADQHQRGLVQEGLDAEQVVMEVQVHTDGSAAWTIQHRVELGDENATQGFEATQQRLEENQSAFREPFAQRVRAMATRAQDQTGRTMVVENISVDAYRQLDQEYGVVAYQFRWYGFAETDDALRVGDALSGLFLDEETKLLMSWPEETTLAEVSPDPDDRRESSVVWSGPVEFASGEPRLTLESKSGSFGPDLSFGAESNDVFITVSLFLLVVGSLGTGVVVFIRRRRADDEETATEPETTSEAVADEAEKDETAEPAAATEAAGETETAAVDAETVVETETAETGGETDDAEQTAPPEELLSNEERVLKLLDDRGGRVKQQEIVESFGWSETKTSEVVSDLRETEEIEVYRLGRENVLALPETGLGIDTDDDSGGETE